MLSASLIVEARRRAGLSQRELALRLGKRQAEIARWERGHVLPSLERLRDVIAACGLELTCGLAVADDSYDHQILAALTLPGRERLARAVAAADRGRQARALATGAPAPTPLDVVGALRALEAANVAYVLAGEIAEVLHGSPLMPTAGVITIVPRPGERAHLDGALVAMQARSLTEPSTVAVDAPECWRLAGHGVELLIAPAPAGSRGYEDLRRDAITIELAEGLQVSVASLIDLVRLAEASAAEHDRARVPALRRTLELATAGAAGDAAAA
jgi:transcriptional regulator with XRE-family HTH domain